MGAKDSKRSCLSYEDAVKRMSDAEFKRVCEAFKRLSGGGQLLSRYTFTQNVLGDCVPVTIADWLYTACGGGSKGIPLRDLVCGLVLLTKGTLDEKIKFLWTLYSNDSGTYISRADFQAALQIEGSLPANLNRSSIWWDLTITSLFGMGHDRVGFEQFRSWIMQNKEATVLSKWLLTHSCVTLSSELETPTFYQTLAGVTHLEEQDICELEKCFWSLSSTSPCGQLDLTCVNALVSPPVPASVCPGLFMALDVNSDGHVDFKELCCGISAACRGPTAERIKFTFKIFDMDSDGFLNTTELRHMIDVLLFINKENKTFKDVPGSKNNSPEGSDNGSQTKLERTVDEGHKKIIDKLKTRLNSDGFLSQEEFLIWGVDDNQLILPLLQLLFEVCHVSLGLKPHCRHHEYEIVMGWLSREESRGYRIGQFWYLVSSEWWQTWLSYVTAPRCNTDHCTCRSENRIPVEEGIACDESFTSSIADYTSSHSNEFTSNSTDSMGDLLSRGDSCSIASSSGVSSSSGSGLKRSNQGVPGPIDNSNLVAEPLFKVGTLTGEGGRLKRDTTLVQHRDFELIPDSLWKALALWYGGPLPLPRQVILPTGSHEVELELYPLNLRILRHQTQQNNNIASNTWTSVVGGYGAAALTTAGITTTSVTSSRRYLAHTAAFSRLANVRQVIEFLSIRLGLRIEDVRLWHVKDSAILMDDEIVTLEELGIQDSDQILLEVRNKDLTWPEELGALASGAVGGAHGSDRRATITLPPGATGLHNLGNTCFMNAALQAVSNTRPLTQYFQRDQQLCELNTLNPLGTRGQVARRYAELCRELWAGSTRSVAPLKLRWCVTKHAPHLGGGGQHDSQELLAWLLDALHEDLNRVARKQYTELRDSDGRPDTIVADEAWRQHLNRDHSIITDLFYGQLKSKVTCQTCGHESVRFDAFNLLSLPLPMESYILCEVLVIRLNGGTPIKYGLRQNSEAKYLELKQQLQLLCNIPSEQLLLAEVAYSQIRQVLSDDTKINVGLATEIYAYELPYFEEKIEECTCVSSDGEAEVKEAESFMTQCPEVRSGSALCMPNILCFKNKKIANDYQKKLSIISHNGQTSTFYDNVTSKVPSYLVAVHRKCVRQETYFLSQHKSKPILFGIPLLLGCDKNSTCQSLYEAVWNQVNRLLSPLPQSDQTNHATDCDDSLGYEFPFSLKAVLQGGQICALCHWSQFCRGCSLPCSQDLLFEIVGQNSICVAIDWDPTALHLRYQSSREKVWTEHSSVAICRKLHTEPIDLDYCLKAFTSEERLETKYHCSKCQDKQPATKKLQIWRLPPILIIHLKRFDYVNNKWVKTQKVVNFPFKDFDPTAYLASVPQETILRHRQIMRRKMQSVDETDDIAMDRHEINGDIAEEVMCNETCRLVDNDHFLNRTNRIRERLISTSLQKTPILDENLHDFHEHKLLEGQDLFDLRYQLYAVVSHSGLLNGGHYVSYACNPNGHWYCYNDSSCREVPGEADNAAIAEKQQENCNTASIKTEQNHISRVQSKSANTTPIIRRKTYELNGIKNSDSVSLNGLSGDSLSDSYSQESITSQLATFKCAYSDAKIPKIDTSNAYILFYERSGLNYKPYLPDVTNGLVVAPPEVELDESESELRKQLCSLQ